MEILISIQPEYSQAILDGTKTVELRRRAPVSATRLVIYETSPTCAVVGQADIRSVERIPVTDIWDKYAEASCIGRKEFFNYFRGLKFGYAISLMGATRYSNPLSLDDMRSNYSISPPQSWQYLKVSALAA